MSQFNKIKTNFSLLLLYIFFFLTPSVLWWLAFFPGIMTSDSIDQWCQSLSGKILNAHPIMSTLLFVPFSRLTPNNNIYVYTFFQNIVFSLLIFFFIFTYYKITNKYFLKNNQKIFTLLTYLFLFLSPNLFLLAQTMWKDVVFTLIISTIFLVILNRKKNNTFIIIFSILLTLIRHEGFFYVPFIYFAYYYWCDKKIKKIIILFFITLSFSILLKNIFFKILNIPKNINAPTSSIKLHDLTYLMINNKLSVSDENYLLKITDKNVWTEKFVCYSFDYFAFNESNTTILQNINKNKIDEIYYRNLFKNPITLINKRLCALKYIATRNNNFSYVYTTSIESAFLKKRCNLDLFQQTSFNHIKDNISEYIYFSTANPIIAQIYWGFSIQTITLVIMIFISFIKKNYRFLSYYFLLFSNLLLTFIIALFPDYRYHFYLTIFLPFIIILPIIQIKNRFRE